MLNLLRGFFLVVVLASISTCAHDGDLDPLTQQVDDYMSPLVEKREFSGVIMVARGDEILVERAYGMADFETGIPHRVGDSFAIASLSKTFTAAALAILVERGELRLGETIDSFFPDFPRADEITVEMLLLHQSGVEEEHQFPDYSARRQENLSLAVQVDRIGSQPLKFEPGTSNSYSNSGYVILARIVEIVSGQSFDVFLRTEVFQPLDLRDTAIDWTNGDTVPGYLPGLPPSMIERARRDVHPSHGLGASEIRSTASDLLSWLRAIQAKILFNLSAFEYPYGWGVREYFGRPAIEQSGITGGFVSAMVLFPKEELYVVVLSNIRAGRPQQKVHIDLAGLAFGEAVEPLRLPELAPGAAADTARLAGRYDFPGVGVVAVRENDGLLSFEWEGFDIWSYLYPLENGRYWNRIDGAEIDFEKAADGPATALIWGPGDGAVRAPRIEK